jgi:predicted TIM-barrel fold metal-dependent hydrolase
LVPLFDSLSHPTLTGAWGSKPGVATFDGLVRSLEEAGYVGACAVGLAGVEEYEHVAFVAQCRRHRLLVPVAGFDPAVADVAGEVARLKRLGYRGLKLHPRFSGRTRDLEAYSAVLQAAGREGLVVFYCTYMHCQADRYPRQDPLYDLVALIEHAPATKVVLVHGGDVNLLRYAELVRFNQNLLLDLSLTMMKYQGSSLDLDLRFLLERFDRRVCIGTDHPEYDHRAVRDRFEDLTRDLPTDKVENAGYRNIAVFLGLAL